MSASRSAKPLLLAATLVALLAGCGGSKAPLSAPEPTSAFDGLAASSPTATPEPSGAPAPELRGNAATNPACMLLTTQQVSTLSGLAVIALLGLPSDKTNPAKRSESCTWFLDPKVVQSSLVVQYTLYAKPPSDVRAYYPQVVKQGYARAVPHLGDVSKISGHVLDTVYKRSEVHVTLLTHAEATAADQAATIALMRLVLPRIVQ